MFHIIACIPRFEIGGEIKCVSIIRGKVVASNLRNRIMIFDDWLDACRFAALNHSFFRQYTLYPLELESLRDAYPPQTRRRRKAKTLSDQLPLFDRD